MSETSCASVQTLKGLFAVPVNDRDRAWLDALFANVVDARLQCTEHQFMKGPDGFSYLSVHLPENGEEGSHSIRGTLERLLEEGLGFAIFPDKNFVQPLWLFSYGDLLSLSLYGSLEGDFDDKPSADNPGGLDVETLENARNVFLGAPSESYFPERSQNVVARFLKNQLGHPDPRICLVYDPQANPKKGLAFNFDIEAFAGDERALASVLRALSWFFPSTYSLLAGPPIDPKYFLPLKSSPNSGSRVIEYFTPPFGGYSASVLLGGDWIIGDRQFDDQRSIVEFVRPGQTVESWEELVTFHEFMTVAYNVSPQFYLAQSIDGLRTKPAHNIFFESETEVLLAAQYDNGENALHRWFTGPAGVYCVQYAKKSPFTDAETSFWIDALRSTQVRPTVSEDIIAYGKFANEALADLTAGNVTRFISMLSENVKSRVSIEEIESDLVAPVVALLELTAPLPETVVHNCTDAHGSEGFTFYMKAQKQTGEVVSLAVYVVNEDGKLVIANIVPNKTPE